MPTYGSKAAVLAELSAAGYPVPPGFVVTTVDEPALDEPALTAAARRLGADRFAVRSSAGAEDLPDASYAGLYETYLDVPLDGLAEAVRACFAAAGAERVRAYHRGAYYRPYTYGHYRRVHRRVPDSLRAR